MPDFQKASGPCRQELRSAEGEPAASVSAVEESRRFWSVRVGSRYRALAVEIEGGLLWFWIGSHADYDAVI